MKVIIVLIGIFLCYNGIKIQTPYFSIHINGLKDMYNIMTEGSEYRKKLKETQKRISEAETEEELVEALRSHPNNK